MALSRIVDAVEMAVIGFPAQGGLEYGSPDDLVFDGFEERLILALSKRFSLPDIEMRMPLRRSPT